MFSCGGVGDSGALADAEVIDLGALDGSLPSRNCNEVPPMPNYKYSHFAVWDKSDESALCCGGWDGGDTSIEYKQCFKYAGEEWMDLGDILKHIRIWSSAAELNDGRYWIAGGETYYYINNEHTS